MDFNAESCNQAAANKLSKLLKRGHAKASNTSEFLESSGHHRSSMVIPFSLRQIHCQKSFFKFIRQLLQSFKMLTRRKCSRRPENKAKQNQLRIFRLFQTFFLWFRSGFSLFSRVFLFSSLSVSQAFVDCRRSKVHWQRHCFLWQNVWPRP